SRSMQPNILTFLQANIFLVLVCVASGIMLIWPMIQKALSGSKEVSVPQAVQLINRRDAVILDVREASEYAAGHIPNARHIPVGDLDKRVKELDKFKQRPIVVVCQTGSRSATACGKLRKGGFAEAFNLK